jgi:hypothetical protein
MKSKRSSFQTSLNSALKGIRPASRTEAIIVAEIAFEKEMEILSKKDYPDRESADAAYDIAVMAAIDQLRGFNRF